MTGAEMQVTMSSTVAASSRKVPKWWMMPVLAIVMVVELCLGRKIRQVETAGLYRPPRIKTSRTRLLVCE